MLCQGFQGGRNRSGTFYAHTALACRLALVPLRHPGSELNGVIRLAQNRNRPTPPAVARRFAGTELAQIIRFQDEWLRVPIVYLSAETDLARQMDALLRAGDDFVTKPVTPEVLYETLLRWFEKERG